MNFLEKSVDRILSEIAYVGIGHNLSSDSSNIVRFLKERNINSEFPVIAEAMLLINDNKLSQANDLLLEAIQDGKMQNNEILRSFRCLVLKLMGNTNEFNSEINSILSGDIKDEVALNLAKGLIQD